MQYSRIESEILVISLKLYATSVLLLTNINRIVYRNLDSRPDSMSLITVESNSSSISDRFKKQLYPCCIQSFFTSQLFRLLKLCFGLVACSSWFCIFHQALHIMILFSSCDYIYICPLFLLWLKLCMPSFRVATCVFNKSYKKHIKSHNYSCRVDTLEQPP